MTLFKPGVQARFGGEYFTSPTQLIPTRPPFATAGVPVTPTTAIQKVALQSAVNLVADMPTILDYEVYTGQGGHRRPATATPAIEDPEGEGYGLADFAYKYLACRMLRGNVFIRVDAVGSDGRPTQCTILDPADVIVLRDSNGRITFRHRNGVARRAYPQQGVGGIIHRRAYPQTNSVLGLSVVANHARTLGVSLAAEQFGADFFADGAHPTGILASDKPVDEAQARTIKARFMAAIRGSREPAVLGAGVKYTQVQIAPNESQFLDAQKFSAAEICRMVGPGVAEMLGYDTGGRLTYQNVEMRSLHLLVYTVDKWVKEFETCVSEYFLPRSQHIEYDRDGILRMTAQERWKVYQAQLATGARVINEVRDDEGEHPVPWGDEPYLPAFGSTGTSAAEAEQIDAMDGKMDGKLGKVKQPAKVPPPPKIGGVTS